MSLFRMGTNVRVLKYLSIVLLVTLGVRTAPISQANSTSLSNAASWDDPSPSVAGMIFTVNKTADTGDGVCNAADCSLREAIIAANANVGLDSIVFNIGSGLKTIQPTSILPNITDPVSLDATTQPGFSGSPLIEIDGTISGEGQGITLTGGNSTIRGLIINGFRQTGLQIFSKGNNLIAGNYIGTNATGTAAKSLTRNNGIGIVIDTANNVIGGTTVADRNIISGNRNANGSSGIWLRSATATNNKVIGNYIGTDVTGTVLIPHLNIGINVFLNASGNTIGGLTLERNVIAGNPGCNGIAFHDASNNKVMRNFIGIGPLGTQLGIGTGIMIDGNSDNNVIGGPGVGDGNVIAYAAKQAIWNLWANSTGNSFLGNSIFNNDFAIDLGDAGITPNDSNDPDSGPNNLQNFPLLTSANATAGSSQISGTLNGINGQYRVELFSNTTCHPSGNGEGKAFLGATTATVASNNSNFNATVPFDVSGRFLTATATDSSGNTSEFSPCLAVPHPGGTVQFSANTFTVPEAGTASVIVKRTVGATGAASVQYQTANNRALAGSDYSSTSGTLNWANGDSSDKTISIQTSGDVLDEFAEDFLVTLSNPTGTVFGSPTTAIVTISDDDPTPSLSINDVSKVEGNSGTTAFTFTVTLSTVSGQDVRFDFANGVGGTATFGTDYQPSGGPVLISEGNLSTTVTLVVNGDMDEESNETVFVNIMNAQAASIGDGQGVATIINDDNVSPTTVQFSQTSYDVQEALGAVTITVNRTGDSSGSSSVFYTTNDGTATQKGDFEYASGKLQFAPGETSKSFVLLINEDNFVEGSESLSLTLSNPVGAALGQQSNASVAIADDASEPSANPIDNSQNFVYMNYHDFLNREPDPAGLAFWTSEITSCGNSQCVATKRTNVSAAFFLSIEFQETGYLVYKTYKAAYGNIPGAPVPIRLNEFFPDTQEIRNGLIVNQPGWQQLLENNKNAFMLDFVQRAKFGQTFPTSLSPAQFVDQMFATAGVVPSLSQREGAMSEFGNVANTSDINARARVLRIVAENPTLAQQEFNKAFVLMQYFGYLRRNPNDAPEPALNFDGYNFWLNKLNQFNGNFADADMVKAFILSGEYRQRFGQ